MSLNLVRRTELKSKLTIEDRFDPGEPYNLIRKHTKLENL